MITFLWHMSDSLHVVLWHVSILYKKSRSDNGIICINQITAMPLRLYINYTPIYLPENTLHFPANKNPLGFSNNIFKRFNKCNVCSLWLLRFYELMCFFLSAQYTKSAKCQRFHLFLTRIYDNRCNALCIFLYFICEILRISDSTCPDDCLHITCNGCSFLTDLAGYV